eukprot:Sdes_comp19917_c0_seq1m12342
MSEDVALSTISLLNLTAFQEVVDMGGVEFMNNMLSDFFLQAESKFPEFQSLFSSKDFSAISRLGHFLRSSSATLGLARIQHICSQLQKLGNEISKPSSDTNSYLLIKKIELLIREFPQSLLETKDAVKNQLETIKKE